MLKYNLDIYKSDCPIKIFDLPVFLSVILIFISQLTGTQWCKICNIIVNICFGKTGNAYPNLHALADVVCVLKIARLSVGACVLVRLFLAATRSAASTWFCVRPHRTQEIYGTVECSINCSAQDMYIYAVIIAAWICIYDHTYPQNRIEHERKAQNNGDNVSHPIDGKRHL